MKASLIFFPNEAKKNLQKGSIPLYLRVCFKRKKVENRLNFEIAEKELLRWDPFTMRIQERNSPVNHYLNRIEQKFQDLLIMHATCLQQLSAADIRDMVLGVSKKQVLTIMDFVDKYFEEEVLCNSNKTAGTTKGYRRAINHLKNFFVIRNEPKLTIDKLNYDVAADFKNFLVNKNPTINRPGMMEVSAAGVIKKFRTIFNQAVDRELINKNPFKLVKIKAKSSVRERLTIFQVKQIWDVDLGSYPIIEIYRDLFIFGVLTGLAYRDLMDLAWKNVEERKDGNIKLSLNRIKTDVTTETFLTSLAIDIARKYRQNIASTVTGKVFPYRSNKEFNSQLKFLAQLAGVHVRLSSHIARHTFRQLLAEAEIDDYGVVKKMMGHSRGNDIDGIYNIVTETRLLSAKNKFEKYLLQNLNHD